MIPEYVIRVQCSNHDVNNWASVPFVSRSNGRLLQHNGIKRTCNFVSVDQISPNADGTFTIEMQVGGDLGKVDGLYTISAQQGSGIQYTDEVMIEIVNGAVVPEFGSAAIIVLVVAIVSIVANYSSHIHKVHHQ